MHLRYAKIKIGNWLFKNCFPLYNYSYRRFKLKNDRDEIAALKRMTTAGAHVLDIGANIGFYARLLSEMVGPEGRVVCFEPERTNFGHLRNNTSGLANVTLFNNAVSDRKGTIRIYRSKLLNVDHRTYPVGNYDSVEDVGSVSIDGLMADGTIPRVDVIKIDIQGYELIAFNGMIELLRSNNKPGIIAECWPHGLKRSGQSAVALFDFFDRLGFTVSKIEEGRLRQLSREYVLAHNEEPFDFSFQVVIEA
jgi:FkbM family methyltransferase